MAAVARGENVNAGDQFSITGLMLALLRGHNHIVQFMVEEPSLHINSSDSDGDTDVHWAVNSDNVTGLRILLGSPRLTSVNKRNSKGWTPLMQAVRGGKVECARELVRVEGVDLETWDNRLGVSRRWPSRIKGRIYV